MDAKSPRRAFTLRCSTIFVSEGDDTLVYRSMKDIPTSLRTRVAERSRDGISATIFIANRGGREELAKRLRGLPSRVRTRLEESAKAAERAMPEPPSFAQTSTGLAPAVRHGLMVAIGVGLLAWLLAAWR